MISKYPNLKLTKTLFCVEEGSVDFILIGINLKDGDFYAINEVGETSVSISNDFGSDIILDLKDGFFSTEPDGKQFSEGSVTTNYSGEFVDDQMILDVSEIAVETIEGQDPRSYEQSCSIISRIRI